MVEKRFQTGVLGLNYLEGPPRDKPLLLLHGGSARWQAFENIIPELAARVHLFALDLRGHGLSDRAENGCYRIRDYATDITAFMQEVIGKPSFVFGHSLGGIIGLYTAAHQPRLFHSLIVGDSPLTASTWIEVLQNGREGLIAWRDASGSHRSIPEIIERIKNCPAQTSDGRSATMRDIFGEEHSIYSDWLAPNLYHQDPDVLTILIDNPELAAAGYEMEQLFPQISCPVLLMQADPNAGGLMRDDEVKTAVSLLPNPHHILLKNISHVLHNEQKEPVLEALSNFLD